MPWKIDTGHTDISFSVKHLMVSNVRGRFEQFSGTVEADENDPTGALVNVTIDADSFTTRDAQRDGHLKSADFLDVATYPTLTFASTGIELHGADRATLRGDLTIRGVTKPVALAVNYNGQATSPWGTRSAGFSATTTISRKEWGLVWNAPLETGGVLVGDEVNIVIDIELLKVD
ncbi:MAG: YceI family protein [Chloroflexi bacterium]|nr:YceI family protein [Chloroflexota bacterium]